MKNNEDEETIKDLRYSMNNNLLVNLIQKDTTVFYTGVVVALDSEGTILITYDDFGLANGLVYVVYEEIYDVDFHSEDLTKMEGRIQLSRTMDLYGTSQPLMKLNQKTDLLTQILGTSFVNQQAVLIVRENGESVEGFIDSLAEYSFSVETVDKFDSSKRNHVHLVKPVVRSIEFLGTELKLLTDSKKELFAPHMQPQNANEPLPIFAALHSAFETGRRVMMVPKLNPNLFFIGQVRAVNEDQVVFSLVDMTGHFGGYELIKIDEIKELIIKSDYLRLVNHFVAVNASEGDFVQPILNDDRSFDPTVDMFEAVMRQAIQLRRVVRLKMKDGESYVAFPSEITDGKVTIQIVDKTKLFVMENKEVELKDVVEIAFGYIDSVMIRKQILG